MKALRIGSKIIGVDQPCFIIAEMSANHNKDFEKAKNLVRIAKKICADAIKVQTYTPDTLTLNCKNKYFTISEGPWAGQTLYDLYQKAYTPWEWQKELKEIADDLGLLFFSTPFDKSAVDFLETLNVPVYKIASFEIIDIPLIEYIASTQKPIILSTGMSSLCEIDAAVQAIRGKGNDQIAILKCTSAYPASVTEMNLASISALADIFNVPAGLSDHSIHNEVSFGAVAMGASIVERHFIANKADGGPDALFSADEAEFKSMVSGIRIIEAARGKIQFGASDPEQGSMIFRRSLFFAQNVKKGERITEGMVRSVRPGYGISPKYIYQIIGKIAPVDFLAGMPVTFPVLYSLLPIGE